MAEHGVWGWTYAGDKEKIKGKLETKKKKKTKKGKKKKKIQKKERNVKGFHL